MRTAETWSFMARWHDARAAIPAFHFRSIPGDERQLGRGRAGGRRRLAGPGSTDDCQLARRLVEALRAGLGGDHDVLDPGAAAAREVDAGLDREGVARRQRSG